MCVECEKSLPNQIVFDKIETIIRMMQDETNGLPVKTAKSFMSKIPSVFTGTDLIQWMMRNLRLDDQQEAIHLANLIASHGYIFPIEDHTLSIKNDCTFYRFQTPCLWPSNNIDPENTDYAVYLCKRTMQGKARLELADYEAENLARLQKMFSRKWEFIFMQAESQAKVDKKRDKLERKVLDSQERAFWDVYRPVPGCVNTTELDIKKACRLSKSAKRCSECQKVINPSAAPPTPTPSASVTTSNQPAGARGVAETQQTDSEQASKPPPSPTCSRLAQAETQEFESSSTTDAQLATGESSSQPVNQRQSDEAKDNDQPADSPIQHSSDKTKHEHKTDTTEQQQQQRQGQLASTSTAKQDDQPTAPSAKGDAEEQQQAALKESKAHSAHHHHHHAHGHGHHHHHHHHHHHPHPHSHHHAHHHHHHHHHHKNCPHHQKQQQAKGQLSTSSSELKSATQGHQCEQHHRASSSKSSVRHAKKHSSSSIDQPTEGLVVHERSATRRRSESQRPSSTSECPSAAAGDQNNNKDQSEQPGELAHSGDHSNATNKRRLNTTSEHHQQVSSSRSNNPKICDPRPASACCSSSGRDQVPSAVARQTSTELAAAELRDRVGPGGGFIPMVRKSSLNILRSSQDQHSAGCSSAALGAGRKGSVHLAASSSSSMFSHHPNQRAQLKGTQSVCDNSSAGTSSATCDGDAQELPAAADGYNSSSTVSLVDRQNINELERELESLKVRRDRGGVKMSKVTQSYLSYFKQWAEYDPFIAQPTPSNPWQSDSTELWDSERQTKDVHCRRVRRWAFSLKELLSDPAGREQFHRFLEKEFSAENLKFWDAVQELKRVPSKDVARRVEAIWTEYLAQDANCPINIDSKSYETSKKNMAKNKNNRYIFDEAAGHVYQLMKNDSYPRYLRSDMYKDYKEASERRRPNQVAFDVFKPQITTLKHKFNF